MPGDLDATLEDLAPRMDTRNAGTWDDAFAEGKLSYITDNGLPISTHYAGGGAGCGEPRCLPETTHRVCFAPSAVG